MSDVKSLVYVDLSNVTSTKGCPINSDKTPCIVCEEKCKLSFTNEYFQASCNIIEGGLFFTTINTNTNSYLTFNEDSYTLDAAYLLAPSINTYSKKGKYCDVVFIASSGSSKLIIYIPISVGGNITTIALPNLEEMGNDQTFASINLFSYLPSQLPFYYYNASYNGESARYIIFPNTSCNGNITTDDYNKICDKTMQTVCPDINPLKNPTNNYFELYTNSIYYNELGANISENGEYYLDCYMTDQDEEIKPNEFAQKYDSKPADMSKTMNGLLYILFFIVVIVVCFYLVQGYLKFIKKEIAKNAN
uniref:Transmembrane protein n=1 Tax=viral metagenome TaxID=1070528 RepID=A0A6C0HTE4_9ZZZZ